MGRPAVKGTVDKTARPIRTSMINQSADNAQTPVGIAFLEEERIGREVPVKFDLARAAGIPVPAFETLQALPEHIVADAFGVLHYLIVVLLTHDFHNVRFFKFNFIRTNCTGRAARPISMRFGTSLCGCSFSSYNATALHL